MTRIKLLFFAIFLLCAVGSSIAAAESKIAEKDKIEALLAKIENLKDAVFVRNGSEYDAKTAAKFLRGKWQANTAEIKTAKDFIDKAATRSSTSGKPYVIKFTDKSGKKSDTKCSDYLLAELEKIENQK